MTKKEKLNNFFLGLKTAMFNLKHNKTFLVCSLLTLIYLISGYFKWIEIAVSVCALIFMIILPIQSSFCIFTFLHCFTLSNIGYDSCFMVTLIGYTLILLVKYILGVKKGKYVFYKKIVIAICIFLAIGTALSLFKSLYRGAWLYYIYFVLIYLIFAMRNEFNIHQGMNYMLGGLITSCSLGLFTLLWPYFQYNVMFGNRFRAFVNNPNYLYMRALFLLAYYMFCYLKNNLSHLKFLTIFGLCALIAISTLSKTAFGMLALMLCLFIILYLKDDFKSRIKIVAIFLLVLLGFCALCHRLILSVIERFLYDFNHANLISSLLTGRDEIWRLYLDEIFASPLSALFGNGLLTKQVFVANQFGPTETHSFYIFLLYRFGIIGTLAFGFIVYLFIKFLNKEKPKIIAYLPLVFILIESLFDNTFKCYNFTYFLFAIMILFIDCKDKQFVKKDADEKTRVEEERKN